MPNLCMMNLPFANLNLQFNFFSAISAMIILSEPNSTNALSTVRTAPERNIDDSIDDNRGNCCITEACAPRPNHQEHEHTENGQQHPHYSFCGFQFHSSSPPQIPPCRSDLHLSAHVKQRIPFQPSASPPPSPPSSALRRRRTPATRPSCRTAPPSPARTAQSPPRRAEWM